MMRRTCASLGVMGLTGIPARRSMATLHSSSSCALRRMQSNTLQQAAGISMVAKRNWSLNPFGKRETDKPVEAELPEIFAEQPEEIDDYIRPERSTFEKMEDWWEYIATFMDPVEKNSQMLKYLYTDGVFGCLTVGGWGQTFFFYGLIIRCFTLIPSLYAHRNGLRMQQISTPMNELNNKEKTLKADKTISSADRRVVADGYKRMKKAMYKKHGCAQWKSGVAMITTPFLVTAFMAIRRLAVYEEDLERANFLWITDLTLPDPMFALPLICSGLFVLNFELNQAMMSGARGNTSLYIKWGARVGSLVFAYFASAQPAALFSYWIGMSMAGMLQPILLRNQAFRDYFKFPDPPAAAKAKIGEVPGIKLQQGLLQKLFGKKQSAEEKKKLREEYQAEQARLKQKSFQRVSDVDVVFDDEEDDHLATKKNKK